MINILLTDCDTRYPDVIYSIDKMFEYVSRKENYYAEAYDMNIMRIVDDVTDRIGTSLVKEPMAIPLVYLSTGAKAAILALHGYKVFSDSMGNNAYAALIETALMYNKDITLHGTMLHTYTFDVDGMATLNGKPMQLRELVDAMCDTMAKLHNIEGW